MVDPSKTKGALTTAATAFEEELSHYSQLTQELRSNPINSQKLLLRAQRSLEASVQCDQRMAERVAALAEAMQAAKQAQETHALATLEAAKRIQARSEQLGALLSRFASLGERAHTLQQPVSETIKDGETPDANAVLGQMREIVARMESIVEDAGAMADAAQAGEWEDVARDATSLRQQVQSARNKALLVIQKLAPIAPS